MEGIEKMKLTKRIIAFALALTLVLALAACAKDGTISSGDDTEGLEGKTISIALGSHPSWPYEEGWEVWKYMREGSGANLEINAYPNSDYSTKITLMFASPETLPDIMYLDYKPGADDHAEQGAIRALDDFADIMPNYNAYLDSLPEAEREALLQGRKYLDGKVYLAPTVGKEATNNTRAWLYRKDIFEKHNIELPKTMEDVYNVAKQLKALYPESYPFCLRAGLDAISVIGPSWKPYFQSGFYYDFNTDEWCYGAGEDTMLEIVKYFKKFVDEGLVPPDFLTINSGSWQELVSTSRGFFMPEYQVRIDFFNPLGRQFDPDFNISAFVPPHADNGVGVPMVMNNTFIHMGLVLCNTKNETRIRNAARFLDWMYSDEAVELLSWGKEGETYEVVDGEKKYILDEAGNSAQVLYGIQSNGSFLRLDPDAALALCTDDYRETVEMVAEHTMEFVNPINYLSYTSEEAAILADKSTAIDTYSKEMLSKFILGQEPLSKWDEFKEGLLDCGLEEAMKIYETAYNRVK